MLYSETLIWIKDKLKIAKIPDFDKEANIILCEVLKTNYLNIYMNRDKRITDSQYNKLKSIINQRIKRIPLQYILKKQNFMGYDFKVNSNVLIPRPETEILVETVVNLFKEKRDEKIIIADIGCGCGVIAILLTKILPNIKKIYAIDISQDALNITYENIRLLKIPEEKIELLQGDKLSPLPQNIKLNCIVSNPPYIPEKEINSLQPEIVKYEPKLALNGGKDGLDFYRYFSEHSHKYLVNGGYLCLEIGHNQFSAIKRIFINNKNLKLINVHLDLNKIKRNVVFERI